MIYVKDEFSPMWHPHKDFKVTQYEIEYIKKYINYIKTISCDKTKHSIQWEKRMIHAYFKNVEQDLLINFRDKINMCYIYKETISEEWIDDMKYQWRMLALLRDLHDHMCGRDATHHIRTDDCRRFMKCALNGINNKHFSKPVHRLLCGENAPLQFKHPLFTQFNK